MRCSAVVGDTMLGRGHNLSLLLPGCLIVSPVMEATNPCKLFTKKINLSQIFSAHSNYLPYISFLGP